MRIQNPQSEIRNGLCAAAATAGGLGYLPGMPGTWGTLLGVGVYLAAGYALEQPARTIVLAAALVAACTGTVLLGPWAERSWGRKDPQTFVLDEVAGYMLVVVGYPFGPVWRTAVVAFIAARVFDIVKPFPVGRVQGLPAGWGILLDDLLASVYALAVMYGLHFVITGISPAP
jgi:phosphatidylglycerophosphatase A